jgi:hypothetical protein
MPTTWNSASCVSSRPLQLTTKHQITYNSTHCVTFCHSLVDTVKCSDFLIGAVYVPVFSVWSPRTAVSSARSTSAANTHLADVAILENGSLLLIRLYTAVCFVRVCVCVCFFFLSVRPSYQESNCIRQNRNAQFSYYNNSGCHFDHLCNYLLGFLPFLTCLLCVCV